MDQNNLTYKSPTFFDKLKSTYYKVVDKLHLTNVVSKIDKYFPSYYLLLIILIILIILITILYFYYTSSLNVKFDFYKDGSLVGSNVSVQFVQGKDIETKMTQNGSITINLKKGSKVTLRVLNLGYNFERDYTIFKDNFRVDIQKSNISNSLDSNQTIRTFIYFKDSSGALFLDNVNMTLVCPDNTSDSVAVSGGVYKFDKKADCTNLKIKINMDGFLSVDQDCITSKCDVSMQRAVSQIPVSIPIQRNSVAVYVKDYNYSPYINTKVELIDSISITNVIDTKYTNELGYVQFSDIAVGNYKVRATNELKGYAKTVELELTAGSTKSIDIVFDKPSIGTINLKLNSEGNGSCLGQLFYSDQNRLPIGSQDINCNSTATIGIFEKGNYIFSFRPYSPYDQNYVPVIDFNVNYSQENGPKNVTMQVSKIKYTDVTMLKVRTISKDGLPIPNMTILFDRVESNGNLSTLEVYTKNTDSNGYAVIPNLIKGNYKIRAESKFYSGTPYSYTALEHTGATSIYKEPNDVIITVDIGKALVSIQAYDDLSIQTDYNIDVYKNGLLISSYNSTGAKYSFEASAFEYYFFVIKKSGYTSYISQNQFLIKDQKIDINAQLKNLRYITGNSPKVLDVRIYDSPDLKSESSKIEASSTYYYSFKILLPTDYVASHITSNKSVYFHAVTGALTRNNDIAKNFIEDVYAPHISTFYKFFGYSQDVAGVEADQKRYAKYTVTKTDISSFDIDNALIYNVVLKTTIAPSDILTAKEPIYLSYAVSDSNYLYPQDGSQFSRLVNYLGSTSYCGNDNLCIDIFYQNSSVQNSDTIHLNPSFSDINIDLTFGVPFSNVRHTLYSNNSKLSYDNLKTLSNSVLSLKNLGVSKTLVGANSQYIEPNNSEIIGPVFIDKDSQNYQKDEQLSFYSLVKPISNALASPTNLVLQFDDSYKLVPLQNKLDTDLVIDGFNQNKVLVPGIKNSIDLKAYSVTNGDKVQYNGDVKASYYLFDGFNYNNLSIDDLLIKNQNDYTINLPAKSNGTKIRLVFYVPDNKMTPYIIDLNYSSDFLSALSTTVDINVPSDNSVFDMNLKVLNNSANTFKVTDFELINEDSSKQFLFDSAFDLDLLKNSIIGLTLSANSTSLYVKSKYKETLGSAETLNKFSAKAVLTLSPAAEETIFYNVTVPIIFNPTFTQEPTNDNCIILEQSEDNITFIDTTSESVDLTIRNNCEKYGSQYSFDSVDLKIESSDSMPLSLSIINKNDATDSKSIVIGKNNTIPVNASKNGTYNYTARFDLLLGGQNTPTDVLSKSLDDLKGASTKIKFKLVPKYKQGVGGVDSLNTYTKVINPDDLDLNVTTLSECLVFGLDESYVNDILSNMNDYEMQRDSLNDINDLYYRKDNLDNTKFDRRFIRLPYEYRINNYGGLFGENEGQYLLKDLVISYKNNCGKNLNINAYALQSDNSKQLSINPNVNGYLINRDDYSSGALRIQLKDEDNGVIIKELYLNIQSVYSKGQYNFVLDSFGQSDTRKTYSNYIGLNAHNQSVDYNLNVANNIAQLKHDVTYASYLNNEFIYRIGSSVFRDHLGIPGLFRFKGDYTFRMVDVFAPVFSNVQRVSLNGSMIPYMRFGKNGSDVCNVAGYNAEIRYNNYDVLLHTVDSLSCNQQSDYTYQFLGDDLDSKSLLTYTTTAKADFDTMLFSSWRYRNGYFDVNTTGDFYSKSISNLESLEHFDTPEAGIFESSIVRFTDQNIINNDLILPKIQLPLTYYINNPDYKKELNDKIRDQIKVIVDNKSPGYKPYIVIRNAMQLSTNTSLNDKMFINTKCPDGYQFLYSYINRNLLGQNPFTKGFDIKYNYNESELDLGIDVGFNNKSTALISSSTLCIMPDDNIRRTFNTESSSVIDTDPIMNDIDSLSFSMSSCSQGGFTGKDIVPNVWFANGSSYDSVNCEDSYCDVKQLSKYLDSKLANVSEFIGNVKLIADNYSIESLSSSNTGFGEKYSEYSIIKQDGTKVGYLIPGIYQLKVSKNDKKLYLWYKNGPVVDSIFYYMPYNDGLASQNSGTIFSQPFIISNDGRQFSSDISGTGLFNYTIDNISDNKLPFVFTANLNKTQNGGTGDIKFLIESNKVNCLQKKDITSSSDFDPSEYSYWNVYVLKGDKVYSYQNFFDLTKSENSYNILNKSNLDNATKIYLVGNRLTLVNECSGLKIQNLSDLFTNIGNNNICYRNDNSVEQYYYNIHNFLISK